MSVTPETSSFRAGNVAIVGRSNVGKSTFLNALLGEPLAVTSPVPQTTRDNLLGVVHLPGAQVAFLDTPGIHKPRSELGRRMNLSALEATRSVDLIIMVVDARESLGKKVGAEPELPTEDLEILRVLPKERTPLLLVLNKVDLVRPKERLLSVLEAWNAVHDFAAIVPTSFLDPRDAQRVLEVVTMHLPEGSPAHDGDTLTDRPLRFFMGEYVREQVLLQCQKEVPHAVAITVDEVLESKNRTEISATLHVEKEGQKRILVGSGGSRIKAIGIKARERIQERLGHAVTLRLFVRVSPRWRDIPRMLSELGYQDAAGEPKLKSSGAKKPTKPRK